MEVFLTLLIPRLLAQHLAVWSLPIWLSHDFTWLSFCEIVVLQSEVL